MKLKIKKGDTVQITSGSDKGLKGTVLSIDPKKMQVRVQGARIQTHFDKQQGVLKKEGLLDYSNIKLVEKAAKEGKKASKAKSAKK